MVDKNSQDFVPCACHIDTTASHVGTGYPGLCHMEVCDIQTSSNAHTISPGLYSMQTQMSKAVSHTGTRYLVVPHMQVHDIWD